MVLAPLSHVRSATKTDGTFASRFIVIPAEAGIQVFQGFPDLGFRRGDQKATLNEVFIYVFEIHFWFEW